MLIRLTALFGMFFTHENEGGAELTLGGVDTTKFTGDLIYADNDDDGSGTWQLDSTAIYVNGQTTSTLNQGRTIIFDSGTSNVLFTQSTANAIHTLISPGITANKNEPGTYGIACSTIPTLAAVIDIEFTASDGSSFNLTIPSSELSVGPFASNSSECQTLINVSEGYTLVGASVLKHYYSAWDVGNQRMGFAATGF